MVLRMLRNWKALFVTAVNSGHLVMEEHTAFLRQVCKDTGFRIQVLTLECMLLIWIPSLFICFCTLNILVTWEMKQIVWFSFYILKPNWKSKPKQTLHAFSTCNYNIHISYICLDTCILMSNHIFQRINFFPKRHNKVISYKRTKIVKYLKSW